jgi:hypothetical protein
MLWRCNRSGCLKGCREFHCLPQDIWGKSNLIA